jgi:hypothetical protein
MPVVVQLSARFCTLEDVSGGMTVVGMARIYLSLEGPMAHLELVLWYSDVNGLHSVWM